ncbi:PP2C family protein-serine/threonine phosphatase [Brevibacillus laterosporus]|uniref:PP2C family protein-serine/threonine phosphatase n=1 Tax=Brevibacillus laterosporus TaxID=1465 RepID=UPI0018F86880|nr:PP2C family serine/threonine-protein phosphatase [Brevibacillus laterosporus]MBG9773389.1 serine/threonine protein phosphatase [Brevibacillus laterosporus]
MRKENSNFQTSFVSEAGTFIENRDYFAFVELDDVACWVIADGIDTDKEVKSAEMAVQSILQSFLDKPTMSRRRLKKYIFNAHNWLKEESTRVRLKASIMIVVTDYSKIIWAVAGNARLYHFRHGRLQTRSHDQSLAQQMADEEQISLAAIDKHEERHNLLSYLGKPDFFEPYVSKKILLSDGDVMMLCTPGAWEEVSCSEMLETLEEAKGPEEMADQLEEVLLSKQKQVIHNYTIASIYANKVFKEDPKKRWKKIKTALFIGIPVLLLVGGLVYMKVRAAERFAENVASIYEHEKSADAYVSEKDYDKALLEYSEARNASKRIDDNIYKQLLSKKLKITELIVNGDKFVKDGKLKQAVESYKKALEEAKNQKEFDKKEIQEKIDQAEKIAQVQLLIKEGDLRASSEDYTGAMEMYQQAKLAAINASYTEGQKEIKTKIDETQLKHMGVEKGTQQLEGEKMEKDGDRLLAEKDLEGALGAYLQAQSIYQEAGMMEKALGIERKITKVDGLLNPLPVPAANGGDQQPAGGQVLAPASGQAAEQTPVPPVKQGSGAASTPAAGQQSGQAPTTPPPSPATQQSQPVQPPQQAVPKTAETSPESVPPPLEQQTNEAQQSSQKATPKTVDSEQVPKQAQASHIPPADDQKPASAVINPHQ